jgi:plastocyanin
MNRKQVLTIVLASAVIVATAVFLGMVAGCSNHITGPSYDRSTGPTLSPGINQVWIENMAFNPGDLTVTPGTKVMWVNHDNVVHTVTSGIPGSPDGLFDSGDLNPGDQYQHTFTTAGTFHYYCQKYPYAQSEAIINVR